MRKFNVLIALVWMGLLLMIPVQTSEIEKIEDLDINDESDHHLMELPENLTMDEKKQKIKKNRIFSCWALKSVIINQQSFSKNIIPIIFSYLYFSPVNAHYIHPRDQNKRLYKATISRDNQYLLSIDSSLSNAYFSNLASGQVIQLFTSAPTDMFHACAIADNPLFVIIGNGGGDNKIYLFNTASGDLIATLVGHVNVVASCSFFSNDTKIVSGSYDQTVRIWTIDVKEGTWNCQFVLRGHTSLVTTCMVTADNKHIVSMALEFKLRVWKSATGECERVLTGHTKIGKLTYSCVISSDSLRIASVGYPKEIKLWNIATGACTNTILYNTVARTKNEEVYICYVSAERVVWWIDDDTGSEVVVWNLSTNTMKYSLPIRAQFVSVSAGGNYLMIIEAGEKPLLRVYSFDNGEFIK